MEVVMVKERMSGAIPHYCPHGGCQWSFVGSQKQADGYLAVHLRVVHKGAADPRASAIAAADPDADLRRLERRQQKKARQERALGEPEPEPMPEPMPEPSSPAEIEPRRCKTPGCPHPSNTRYDRGIYHGLCAEVCIPARRERGITRGGERPAAGETAPSTAASASHQNGAADDSVAGEPPILSLIREATRGRRELLEAERRYHEQLRSLRRHADYERFAPILADADRL